MLYRIGAIQEVITVADRFPAGVTAKLCECITVLNDAYNAPRDYFRIGGYALLAECEDDLQAIKAIIDFEITPCEWIIKLCDFLCALYLLGDDFSIVTFMPVAIAPTTLLKKLQGETV